MKATENDAEALAGLVKIGFREQNRIICFKKVLN